MSESSTPKSAVSTSKFRQRAVSFFRLSLVVIVSAALGAGLLAWAAQQSDMVASLIVPELVVARETRERLARQLEQQPLCPLSWTAQDRSPDASMEQLEFDMDRILAQQMGGGNSNQAYQMPQQPAGGGVVPPSGSVDSMPNQDQDRPVRLSDF